MFIKNPKSLINFRIKLPSKITSLIVSAIILISALVWASGILIREKKEVMEQKKQLVISFRILGDVHISLHMFKRFIGEVQYFDLDNLRLNLMRKAEEASISDYWKKDTVEALDKATQEYMEALDKAMIILNAREYLYGQDVYLKNKYKYQDLQAQIEVHIGRYNYVCERYNKKRKYFLLSTISLFLGLEEMPAFPQGVFGG
ncbi:MAG: hypothetical protein HQL27_04185 [Candidatus Omnitrophica bacterium]|nr:hypothetical protein [Candidatus Omnitrophota bacterium]